MKRNELKVGETYAVLAPSQKVSGGRYGFSATAKKVIVVDVEPVWYSSSYGWRHEEKPSTVILDGKTIPVDDDLTMKAASYRDADAKRSVKVMVEETSSWRAKKGEDQTYRYLDVVPLSQVRYTWAEYEAESGEAERQRKAQWAARERAERQRRERTDAAIAQRDALNEVLEGTDLTARVVDSEVVLAGPIEVLRAIIETANDQSFTTKKEAGVR